MLEWGPKRVGLDDWRDLVGAQLGGPERMAGALVLPFPAPDLPTGPKNEYVAEQTAGHPTAIRAYLVAASTTLAEVEADLDGEGIGGFKCYHCYSAREDTQQSYIDEFLPDWTWRIADERGWFIMLHIVRDPALDDPENQRQIREKCERFPNAQLILAHAARGFHGPQHHQVDRLPARPAERLVRHLRDLRGGADGRHPGRVRAAPASVRLRLSGLTPARALDHARQRLRVGRHRPGRVERPRLLRAADPGRPGGGTRHPPRGRPVRTEQGRPAGRVLRQRGAAAGSPSSRPRAGPEELRAGAHDHPARQSPAQQEPGPHGARSVAALLPRGARLRGVGRGGTPLLRLLLARDRRDHPWGSATRTSPAR